MNLERQRREELLKRVMLGLGIAWQDLSKNHSERLNAWLNQMGTARDAKLCILEHCERWRQSWPATQPMDIRLKPPPSQ